MLPEQAAAMSALGAPRYSVFALIQTGTDTIRAWLGVGDFEVEPDDVDTEGGTYPGIGMVGEIPPLRQLVGGTAERIELSLNGADPEVLALADEDADSVVGAQVYLGIVFFDEDWQAVAPVAWLWEGTADVPAVDRNGDGGVTRRVTLSVGSAFTDRTRPVLGFWTDADQRRRSSDDAFCSRVAEYSVESTVAWPGKG